MDIKIQKQKNNNKVKNPQKNNNQLKQELIKLKSN